MGVNPVNAATEHSGPTLDREAREGDFLSQPVPSRLQVVKLFLEP